MDLIKQAVLKFQRRLLYFLRSARAKFSFF